MVGNPTCKGIDMRDANLNYTVTARPVLTFLSPRVADSNLFGDAMSTLDWLRCRW